MKSSQTCLLAIETSCDECSAAVVERSQKFVSVRSNIIFSQIDLHRRFGGIVPEIASRSHLDMLTPVIDEALETADVKLNDLDAIAVTQRPGLIGALLVGVSTAKALAYALNIPLVAVNHLEGHLHSIFIDGQSKCANITPQTLPLLVCLVSGGHTCLYLIHHLPPDSLKSEKLSESRDDAAGEAFDKCAKQLGLPYPGGIHLDTLAKQGNRKAYDFPRPMLDKGLEFSFSGLKTALTETLKKKNLDSYPQGKELVDLCASIQEAIVETIFKKILLALKKTHARGLIVVGGVSANSRLRELLLNQISVPVFFPDLQYCTDNAAMIGACGLFMFERHEILSGEDLLKANAFAT